MPKYPTVAILLAVRNQKRYVRQAIDSVLGQTSDDWELIVVDDGSEDGTREVLREYSDARIHTYRLSNSRGKARCLNEALARSSGRFLLELDGDDWLEPSAVEEILHFTEDWPNDVACIYGNVRVHTQRGDQAVPLFVQKGRPYKDKFDFLLNCDFFAPRIWKRSAVESVGGWPERDSSSAVGRVREAHALAIRLLAQYKMAYRDFTVYNYRKHAESISAQYGRRNAWPTKKQDIISALKLWKAPYTPFFDDFLHLIFLRPDDSDETTSNTLQHETQPEPFQTGPRRSSTADSQSMQTTTPLERAHRPRPEPIIIDTTKETAPKQALGPEPQLIEVAQPAEPQDSASNKPNMPAEIRIPGFPSHRKQASTTSPIAKPQPVNWLQLAGTFQEQLTGPNPASAHNSAISDPSTIWEQKIQAWTGQTRPAGVFFCPIGSVTANSEEGIQRTRFADLLCQYLAKEIGGTALPVTITLRETQSQSAYGGTYQESPAYIQERITSLFRNQLPPTNPLVVLVPALSNSRTAHLLRTSVPDLVDTSVIVLNPRDILIDAGIAAARESEVDWFQTSLAFLEYSLGISAKSPEPDLSHYFTKLVERVRTEVKLAHRRRQHQS